MTPALSPVLLLGWDGAVRAGEQPVPALQPLVEALAPHAPIAVVLPRALATPLQAPNAHVTTLGSLSVEELAGLHTEARPDHWQHPAAPYLGSTPPDGPAVLAIPAAPYIGSEVALVPSLAALMPDAPAAAQDSNPAVATPTDLLLNRDDFADDGADTAVGEAQDLGTDEMRLADPDQAPAFAPERASLPQALASLSAELPETADLNYQVIQYARFATRQALSDHFGVIYATDWPTWLAALEIRQQTGRPLVLHVHSLAQDRNTPADRGWALELERLALRRADIVLAASEAIASRLRTLYPQTASRLQVVLPEDTDTIDGILHRFENTRARR